jgi:DNA-binding transcriptional MerR regulator
VSVDDTLRFDPASPPHIGTFKSGSRSSGTLERMQIGEVARKVGVATSAIRFYEEAGLIPEPVRTQSGYRDYDPAVIDRLVFIRAGQAVGLTLSELGDVLKIRDAGDSPCRHVTSLIDTRIGEIDERIGDLRRLRKDLAALAAKAADFDPEECPPESVCRILSSLD